MDIIIYIYICVCVILYLEKLFTCIQFPINRCSGKKLIKDSTRKNVK